MKLKVIKRARIPKGLVFKLNDEKLLNDFAGTFCDLGGGRLEMEFSDCKIREGSEIEMPQSAIGKYGKKYFYEHFEILEGAPVEEVEPEEQDTKPVSKEDLIIDAVLQLMNEGKVSSSTGKPSCKDLELILGFEVSSKERNAAFEQVEER